MHHSGILLLPVAPQQLAEPALTQPHLLGSLLLLQMPLFHLMQHFQPVSFLLAQFHPLLFSCQSSLAHQSKTGTFYFAPLGTSHIAPTLRMNRQYGILAACENVVPVLRSVLKVDSQAGYCPVYCLFSAPNRG